MLCSTPKGRLAYKPVADPESLLLAPPQQLAQQPHAPPFLPDPEPSAHLFSDSLLVPGKSMLEVAAAMRDAAAKAVGEQLLCLHYNIVNKFQDV